MAGAETLWQLNTIELANEFLAKSRAEPICLNNFIGNTFKAHSQPSEWIDSFNPRTGNVLARVPRSQAAEVDAAVEAATQALPLWSRTSRMERSDILLRISDILAENKELFAVWESIDQGKTLARARAEVDRAIDNFK